VVKRHQARLRAALGAVSRAHAVERAVRLGVLPLVRRGRAVTPDPAVETWREAFGDPGVLAVAGDARCLLLALPRMPPSERAAMHEELAAADPGDVPGLLRAWRVTAGLHASLGAPKPQNGPQAARRTPACLFPPPTRTALRGPRRAARAASPARP